MSGHERAVAALGGFTRFLRCAPAISLGLSLVACGHEPPAKQSAAPSGVGTGSILVEVFIRQEPQSYWQYRITPSSGDVTLVAAGTHRRDGWVKPTPPNGWETCDKAITDSSSDGRFVARCLKDRDGRQTHFAIKAGDREVFTWSPPEARLVDGFAWSPDSRSVALLNHAYRRGTGPLERLWADSGHPISHNTFYLSIIDIASGRSVDYLVGADVRAGEGKIQDWFR